MADTWRRATKDDLEAYGRTIPRRAGVVLDEEEEFGFKLGKRPKRSRSNTKAILHQRAYDEFYDEDDEGGYWS